MEQTCVTQEGAQALIDGLRQLIEQARRSGVDEAVVRQADGLLADAEAAMQAGDYAEAARKAQQGTELLSGIVVPQPDNMLPVILLVIIIILLVLLLLGYLLTAEGAPESRIAFILYPGYILRTKLSKAGREEKPSAKCYVCGEPTIIRQACSVCGRQTCALHTTIAGGKAYCPSHKPVVAPAGQAKKAAAPRWQKPRFLLRRPGK